jgi:probable F420-dependent oxidoreductase
VIRLGVNVPNFGPGTTPESLRAWIEFAEDAGFSMAVMSDHVAPTPDVTALYPSPFYDPFATMAWLAGFSTRLVLGTSVTVLPYRHPLAVARLSTNIDRFTGGRFVLGVGVGWSRTEFDALGIPFDERGRITDEYLAVITRAWHEPELSFDGDHVRFGVVATGPSPVRRAGVPLWVGGNGKAAITRAVRFGDAWHVINPDRAWLRRVGLPYLAQTAATMRKPAPRFCPRIKARIVDRQPDAPDRPLGVGTIEQIRDDLVWLDEAGADVVVLDTNPDQPADRRPARDDWDTLRAIAASVADVVSESADPGTPS